MKMKPKKLLTLWLAGTLALGGTSIVSAQEEIPTVTFYQINLDGHYTQEGIDRVEAAVNEKLGEKYGINMELVVLGASEYATQLNLVMTSDEADLVTLLQGYGTAMSARVANNELTNLDEYFANSSDEMKNCFNETELAGGTYNGSLYGMPRKYMNGTKTVLRMNEEMLNAVGVEADSIYTYEDMDALFQKVHEAYPDVQVLVPQITNTMTNAMFWGDDMSNGNRFVYTRLAEPDEKDVQFVFDNERFQEWCTWIHKWYEDGYVMADVLSNTNTNGATLIQAGNAFAEIANADLYTPEPGLIDADILHEPHQNPGTYTSVNYCIPSNSDNKDAAWTLLEVLYTDKELANMIAYGVEGEDYVIDENGLATFPEGVEASQTSYGGPATSSIWPNYEILYESYRQFPGYIEAVKEWNETCLPVAGMGFIWDDSELTNQLTSCKNVMDKYYKALLCGMVDPEEMIPRAKEELIAAGGQEILDSIQEQFTAKYWSE